MLLAEHIVTTAQQIYNDPNKVSTIVMLTSSEDLELSKQLEDQVTKAMKERHTIHPDDTRAIRIWNNLENFLQFQGLFNYINGFVWMIGLMTLLIGIIGVGNIMLITVKERTREIGIRKALGATPVSIVGMILQESVFITIIAGYLGMIAGIGVVEAVASVIPDPAAGNGADGEGMSFMGKPEIDFMVAMSATVILIIMGTIAGFIPAARAANVDPITAIRDQ